MFDCKKGHGKKKLYRNSKKEIKKNTQWWSIFETLDFMGGLPTYFSEDGQDMMEISYQDGMLIDIGYIESEKLYDITVVKFNDWSNPLSTVSIWDKNRLCEVIQETVYQFRSE